MLKTVFFYHINPRLICVMTRYNFFEVQLVNILYQIYERPKFSVFSLIISLVITFIIATYYCLHMMPSVPLFKTHTNPFI